eukprot:CAMPEP_0196740154 /NCGR_PEP_ID=MMETSP1091-20130531/29261_1 /TAXON_ID=302021 /ORGANISM="Rhodomonas sp., Strain CCMP768" /LENGTH=85 /DNA_ID=CAMNT_0042085127 /DNA_START=13 /DNA_END=270 /DNA_ORIENTATION=+
MVFSDWVPSVRKLSFCRKRSSDEVKDCASRKSALHQMVARNSSTSAEVVHEEQVIEELSAPLLSRRNAVGSLALDATSSSLDRLD